MLTVYAAVTRTTLDGKNPSGWFPEQKLTVPETIEAYTMGSAYAEFQEKEKGSITPGKLADMVLLSDDIFSIDPATIREVKVLKTIVGGKIVWDASTGGSRSVKHTVISTTTGWEGTSSLTPISPLILSFRAGFRRRGTCILSILNF
jgi:urease alpha subunit